MRLLTWVEIAVSAHTQLHNGTHVLRVPAHTQPDAENECMVYCVYMVVEYCRTAYPVDMVRNHTPAMQIDDIKDILTIRPMGWALNEDDIETLSAVTSPIEFDLREFDRSPSSDKLFNILEDQLSNDLPTITIVDAIRLQEEREQRDIAQDDEQVEHSVVVVGMDDHHVYINDPWGDVREPFPHDVFAEAWDVGLNRLVTTSLQSTFDAITGGNP